MDILDNTLLCPKCNTILRFTEYDDWYASDDEFDSDISSNDILKHDYDMSEEELAEYYNDAYDVEDW